MHRFGKYSTLISEAEIKQVSKYGKSHTLCGREQTLLPVTYPSKEKSSYFHFGFCIIFSVRILLLVLQEAERKRSFNNLQNSIDRLQLKSYNITTIVNLEG